MSDSFRPGDLVKLKSGAHAGKVGRIVGIQQSFPDFIGDPVWVYALVDGGWAPDIEESLRIPGTTFERLYNLEHYCR